MLLATSREEFVRGMEGREGIGKVGLRYPIPAYGTQMDPEVGMKYNYQKKDSLFS